MLLTKISGSRKHLPWGIICGILHVFSSPWRFISFGHIQRNTIMGWNWESFQWKWPTFILCVEWRQTPVQSNQRTWTRQLKQLQKSTNHCKKTASLEWTLSTQRAGRHLRNSRSVERSFSEPRTYPRAGWHRIDRIEKLSSVLIA